MPYLVGSRNQSVINANAVDTWPGVLIKIGTLLLRTHC